MKHRKEHQYSTVQQVDNSVSKYSLLPDDQSFVLHKMIRADQRSILAKKYVTELKKEAIERSVQGYVTILVTETVT